MAELVTPQSRRRGRVAGLSLDLASIVVFVAIGRAAHRHGDTLAGMVSTLWPFATGLALGWLFTVLRHSDWASLKTGGAISLSTVAVGMILRVIVGQGTAFAFILVAGGFLGGVMGCWRLAWRRLSRAQKLPAVP